MGTKFILHGGFTKYENESNYSFFREFLKDVPENGKVLMVLFARDDRDTDEEFEVLSSRFELYAEGKALSFVHANEDDFENQLETADAVYIHGGDTRLLIDSLKKYSNLKTKLKDKTVAGSSAGAYALAEYGSAHENDDMQNGLGILPIRVVCHHDSPDLPPSKASVAALKNIATDKDLVLLKDCEWCVFTS